MNENEWQLSNNEMQVNKRKCVVLKEYLKATYTQPVNLICQGRTEQKERLYKLAFWGGHDYRCRQT